MPSRPSQFRSRPWFPIATSGEWQRRAPKCRPLERGFPPAARLRPWHRRAELPTRCRVGTPCRCRHYATLPRQLDTPCETREGAKARRREGASAHGATPCASGRKTSGCAGSAASWRPEPSCVRTRTEFSSGMLSTQTSHNCVCPGRFVVPMGRRQPVTWSAHPAPIAPTLLGPVGTDARP